jgi:REP element-mobilizing transposase RayT
MARLLRVEYAGAIYHVTVRSNGGAELYRDDTDREYWLYRLGESTAMHQVRVHLFCVMANHFHLVVETPRGNLGQFMHSLLTGYTVFFNRRHRTHGHVTQGRYGARLVYGDAYLLKLSRYVHLNPVKVQSCRALPLAERLTMLREYPWSSLGAYTGRVRPPQWLTLAPMLALVGGKTGERPDRYASYVEAGVAEDDEEFQTELMRSARGIGDADFLSEVDQRYAEAVRKARRPEDASMRRIDAHAIAPEAVLSAVAAAAGLAVGELSRRRRGAPLKAIAASLLVRHAGLTQREIASWLGLTCGSAVSCQLRLLPAMLRTDEEVGRLLAASERLVRKAKKR